MRGHWSEKSLSIIENILMVCYACIFSRLHATLHPALSVGQLLGWYVGHTLLFYVSYHMMSLLLPKWSSDLKYCPCPPARDWGSRVSGLVTHYFTLLTFCKEQGQHL